MNKAEYIFEKLAKLSKEEKLVRNVEDSLGLQNLGLIDNAWAEQEAAKQIRNSFVLRHPILTGIPTLGIAPAVAKERARDAIVRKILRQNNLVKDNYIRLQRQMKEDEDRQYQLETERQKATQVAQAAGALGTAYMFGKTIDNKKHE